MCVCVCVPRERDAHILSTPGWSTSATADTGAIHGHHPRYPRHTRTYLPHIPATCRTLTSPSIDQGTPRARAERN